MVERAEAIPYTAWVAKMLKRDETILSNGLRVVQIHLPGFHSLTNFLVIRSGSRYESAANNGVAHFLEHMVFKGTQKYPDTVSIAQAIEGVGGYFNAWTANDHTAYWNVVPSAQWQLGIEMPIELAFESLLRPEDIERERGVILEEIRMVNDSPQELVDHIFGQAIFPNHPLGQLILGTEKTVKDMKPADFLSYRSSHYAPSQALFIVIGDLENKPVVAEIERLTKHLSTKKVSQPKRFEQPSQKNLVVHDKKTDQTHFMLGVAEPNFSFTNSERFAGVVLNAVLGRGMSSRLFLNVREKRGLAYSIHSDFQPFEDTGLIAIYGGVNTTKINEALLAVEEEISHLQTELVPAGELSKAKELIKGSYDLMSDRPVDLARWYGSSHLLGMTESFEEAKKLVEAVSAETVRATAKRVLATERQVMTVVGPYSSDKIFRRFLALP